MSGANRHTLGFIFIVALIDAAGLGIIVPVTPALIVELTGASLDVAAGYGSWLISLYAVTQFFCAPVLGNLSDRFGRRPVLLFSLLAFGLDYLVMGFAPTLGWLFLGRFVAGAAGATFTTANAAIADITPPEQRAQNFGLLGAGWGIGFAIGPVIGGFLSTLGPRAPFFAAAALALLNAAYGFWVMRETLPRENRRPFALRRANPVGALFQMRGFPAILPLFAVVVCYMIAHDANPSVWAYYTKLKFAWSEADIGKSLGAVGLCLAVVQGGLIRWIVPKLGEQRTVYLGFFLMGIGYFGFGAATAGWMIYASILPFALGGVAMPALRGILSRRVPANAQGALQGAITSIMGLTATVSPLIMAELLFGVFSAEDAPIYFPGAPYLAAALLMALGLVIFAAVMRTPAAHASPSTQ